MTSSIQDKLALLLPAAIMANSIMANLPDDLKPDAEAANPETMTENAMAFRLLRTIYNFLAQTIANDAYFPAAPAGLAAASGGVTLDQLLAVLRQPGAVDQLKALVMGGGTAPPPV